MPICKDQMTFYDLLGSPSFAYYGINFGIVALSSLCQKIAMKLAECITFKTESRRTFLSTILIFLVVFNNYGLVYLIAPMKIKIPILS